jgi:metallo-beta-lactamase family protein
VFLVHGEAASAQALSGMISEKFAIKPYIPSYGDVAVFHGRQWEMPAGLRVQPIEPAVKQLQEVFSELDTDWLEAKQKLEELVAAKSDRVPAVLSRLEKVRKFVRKTLSDL